MSESDSWNSPWARMTPLQSQKQVAQEKCKIILPDEKIPCGGWKMCYVKSSVVKKKFMHKSLWKKESLGYGFAAELKMRLG